MTAEVAALDDRVTRLENQIGAGFDRIESLLRREISDLKAEQINDLREANRRLADDQRRLWEKLGEVEKREHQRTGAHRLIGGAGHFLSGTLGAGLTLLVKWFTDSGHPPPPHP